MTHHPGMYYFVDSDGDEHSLKGITSDDAKIALLQALPLGITVTLLRFEPDPVRPAAPELKDVKHTQPGPAGMRIAGRRKARGRNDKCMCGSGKKAKYCCARRGQ